jgi:DNA-binding transcriptional ArsR family regulator
VTAEKSETLVRTEKGICVLRDGEYVPLTKEELQQLIDEKETIPKAEKIEISDTPVVEKGVFGLPCITPARGSKWDKLERNRNLRKAIISLLNKTRKPMCVEEVSEETECAWVTARQILTDLALEGKVKFFVTRDGYGRLYQINEEWLNVKAAEKETE